MILVLTLLVVNLAFAANAIWEFVPIPRVGRGPGTTEVVRIRENSPTIPYSPDVTHPAATLEPTHALPAPMGDSPIEGVIILSLTDGNYKHLFAYHPQNMPLTRILGSPEWDDIHPMVMPGREQVVFTSNQNGYWDLYQLDLANGAQARLTDTLVYDGEPEWSPDGQWIVYESYVDDNLDIFIKQTSDPNQQPIRLTDNPSLHTSPTWSPHGRQVAFVSDRTADQEIWLADLDTTTNRYQNISRMSGSQEDNPAWSPNGRYLAFDSQASGSSVILTWDQERPEAPPRQIGIGSNPVWSPDGSMILVTIQQPNENGLAVYYLDGTLILPYTKLPSTIYGMSWLPAGYAGLIDNQPGRSVAPMPALWSPALNLSPLPAGGRFGIVPLEDVEAPYAFLHDEIDESFIALRQQIGYECGWDFLASLENAYVPITEPPEPGMNPNWLYTGRAIAFNTLTLQADWMVIVREDFEGYT
ncbi:MAG: TolB family protein, partial [Anaerolineae bacterium]|nr:TolB family protein [Anaerolineae bacterium]